MVIGILIVKSERVVKDNPFYGNYVVSDNYTKTIVYEKYVGLVSPKNGVAITLRMNDNNNVTFIIGKYFFTGEREKDYDENTEFSVSFSYNGGVYEATADVNGQLISFDEWFSTNDYEDGHEPDNHYTKKSKDIVWELVDM
jgi:hypothetical protein